MILSLDVDRLPQSVQNTFLAALSQGSVDPATTPVIWDGVLRLTVSDDLLPHLAQHGLPCVREALAAWPRLHAGLAETLARDTDFRVLLALACNRRTPRAALALIHENSAATSLIKDLVAIHPHTPQSVF